MLFAIFSALVFYLSLCNHLTQKSLWPYLAFIRLNGQNFHLPKVAMRSSFIIIANFATKKKRKKKEKAFKASNLVFPFQKVLRGKEECNLRRKSDYVHELFMRKKYLKELLLLFSDFQFGEGSPRRSIYFSTRFQWHIGTRGLRVYF